MHYLFHSNRSLALLMLVKYSNDGYCLLHVNRGYLHYLCGLQALDCAIFLVIVGDGNAICWYDDSR